MSVWRVDDATKIDAVALSPSDARRGHNEIMVASPEPNTAGRYVVVTVQPTPMHPRVRVRVRRVVV